MRSRSSVVHDVIVCEDLLISYELQMQSEMCMLCVESQGSSEVTA